MEILILLIGIVVCIFPIAIVASIIAAIVKKNKENKGSFETIIRNIYIYVILIVAFLSILSGVIGTFRMALDVLLPEKPLYDNLYGNDYQERNENIIELFSTLSLVIAVIPVFIYHNKLAKEARKINIGTDEFENNESN